MMRGSFIRRSTVREKRFFNPASGVIMPFSYHSKRLDTKFLFSWKGRQISYFFCHISGTGSVTFKRRLSNRFSHILGKDVSLVEVGLKVTFSIISPEPEVAAMVYLILIYGHTVAFKRVQACPNRLSHLREKDVSLVKIGL